MEARSRTSRARSPRSSRRDARRARRRRRRRAKTRRLRTRSNARAMRKRRRRRDFHPIDRLDGSRTKGINWRGRARYNPKARPREVSLSRATSREVSRSTLTLNFPRTRSRGIPRAREGTPQARILRFSRIRSLHRRPVRGLLSHVSPLRKRLHSRGRRRVRIAGVRPGRGLARRTDGGSDDSVR